MRKIVIGLILIVMSMMFPVAAIAYEDTDYMSIMVSSAEEGTEESLEIGYQNELLRNKKIDQIDSMYEKTYFFSNSYDSEEELLIDLYNYVNSYNTISEDTPVYPYTDEELEFYARLIMAECGSDWIPDWVVETTASVVVNRVDNHQFPNTLMDVMYQSGQYGPVISGSIWNEKNDPTERIYSIVEDILWNGSKIDKDVLYQSEFSGLGSGNYATYHNPYGTNLYFNYG